MSVCEKIDDLVYNLKNKKQLLHLYFIINRFDIFTYIKNCS